MVGVTRLESNQLEERILRLLGEKSYGLSIEEVSNFLAINRTTASKYLFALESQSKIAVRAVGKAKLHYPRGVKL